jgi:hypothetical protein
VGSSIDGVVGDGSLTSGVVAITAGAFHTCALTSGGGVKCWGMNHLGQLGSFPLTSSAAPRDVSGLTSGVVALDAGDHHTCALTAAGGVKCWGWAENGQLGDGDTNATYKVPPVDVIGLATGVVALSGGGVHSCALGSGGGVKCWGANFRGQLGDGTNIERPTPVDVTGLSSGITAIAAGGQHTCALTSATGVLCWGENDDGELGRGSSGPFQTTPAAVGLFAEQTIAFPQPANYDLSASPVSPTATASSGLPVSFATDTTPSVCTVSGSSLTLVQAGLCTVTAKQAGDADHFAAPNVTRTFLVTDASAPSPPRLANIATRGRVLSGTNDVLIAGFAIQGPGNKTVVVRARGPSLAAAGVSNPLTNPTISVYWQAPNPPMQLATNDDWQQSEHASIIQSIGLAPADSSESAVLLSLGPGLYSAIVDGIGNGTGVAIVEVFEVDHPDSPLVNIATRGQVLTGEDVMIAGFIIQGTGPQKVVVRARGPSVNIPGGGQLANPLLQLYTGQTPIAANDDYGTASNLAELQASGFAPPNALESAILITLNPGAYTAIMSGVGGTTGIGLVEVFAVP